MARLMTPPSHVVVGYDFSAGARPALHRAVELAARGPGLVLHVVCVVDPARPIPSITSYDGVDAAYAARIQEALAAEVQHELDGVEVPHPVHLFVHARIGDAAARAILGLAHDVGAELIVVGSPRDGLGATAAELVRDARCSVEIARPPRLPAAAINAATTELAARPDGAHRYEYRDHRLSLRPPEWPVV